MNSNDAIRSVQAGTIPSNWRVFFARKDFFVEQACYCFFLVIALIAFLIWYTFNTHLIITSSLLLNVLPGPLSAFIAEHLSTILHNQELWRLIDYIAGTILGGFLLLGGIDGLINARNPHAQFVLLLPDGVVLRSEDKKTSIIDYQALSDLFISEYKKDKVKLTLISKEDGNEKRVELDHRFGNPQKLARDITRSYEAQQMQRGE
jgi:hypothetical protein